MKNASALENIHKHGLFGNHDSKDELINIREIKDVLIYQIVKYKKSSISIDKIKIDNLNLPQTLLVSSNHNTRILWIDGLDKGKCSNSAFHAITITIDFISSNPRKVRMFALRSFGESLYHSITDACLEFGYKAE